MIDPHSTVIGRIRLRGPASPRDGGRDRITGLLAAASLRPTGLPPGAVLCIRRLADPSPRRVRLDTSIDTRGREWGDAVGSAIGSLARRAARPADGPVPANADAVVFRDRGELLACLAEDWSGVGDPTHWWWRFLAPTPAQPGSVTSRAWLRDPVSLPDVIFLLHVRGTVVRVLEQLSLADVRAIGVVICEARGLTELARVLAAAGHETVYRDQARPDGLDTSLPHLRADGGVGRADGRVRPGTRARTSHHGPPWAALGREADRLGRLHAALIGIALTIEHDPGVAAGTAFAEATGRWLAASEEPPAVPRVERRMSDRPRMRPACRSAARRPMLRAQRWAGRSADDGGRPSRIASPDVAARHAEVTLDVHAPPRRVVDTGPSPSTVIEPDDGPARFAGEIVETRLGGVFYLLDLALYLGLYGDFTQPARPGLALDAWDFVELLARRLGADEGADDDPVWALLARLAGRRPGERPGRGYLPPADWRVPPDWLLAFAVDGRPWRWSAANGRLHVEHPAGVTVVDIASADRLSRRAIRRELRRYGGRIELRRAAAMAPARGRRPVDRWMGHLAVYARARLGVALAIDADDVADTLFRHTARVHVTATDVDVESSLATLPIAIRVAGLDRDPGWIPAARRSVRFRFV